MTSPAAMGLPAARQGPGPIAGRLVEALDFQLSRRAGGLHPGDHRSPGVGVGTELAQLRPYAPGDDVRRLDPAASARTGIPHVRLQVPERLMTTWLVLDVSPSMAFGTAQRLKWDVAEGAVRVLGRLATRRGGRVALLTCGGPVNRLLAPRSGRGAAAGLERVLAEGVADDGHGDEHGLAGALGRLGRLTKAPGLVIIVSDFRGPVDWRTQLRSIGQRHSLLAVEIGDPREASLPDVGRLALIDPETGERVEVDTRDSRLRRRYEQRERERRDEVRQGLRHGTARHVHLSTDAPWLDALGRGLA